MPERVSGPKTPDDRLGHDAMTITTGARPTRMSWPAVTVAVPISVTEAEPDFAM
jgi:hypothetical protein